MIKINVAEIKKRLTGSESFQYTLTPAQLDLLPEDAPLEGNIEVKGTISNGGDVLLLQAEEKFVCHGTCARCLKDVRMDLTDALRESLLLAIPARVLCKPDCKGICPVCGADRNVTDCHCDTRSIDPRLEALKALLEK